MTCKFGFKERFERTERDCPYDHQLDGATLTELHVFETFEITGRGTVYIVEGIANKVALKGRVVTFDGLPMKVKGFMSCLIIGHDEGHCSHNYSELMADPV